MTTINMDIMPNDPVVAFFARNGDVMCPECIQETCDPTPIKIYRSNMSHYWQMCHRCGTTVVEGAKGWCQLFNPVTEQGKRTTQSYGNEPFIVHGTYGVSNAIGYEIQIDPAGDFARARYRNHDGTYQVTPWCSIEHEVTEPGDFPEPLIKNVFGSDVPLDQVMRVNPAIPKTEDDESETPTFDPKRQVMFIWDIDDVKEVRPDLTPEQAMDVLTQCKRNHDAEVGMSWDTIRINADDMYPKPEDNDEQD
jgi:hypothetical protein